MRQLCHYSDIAESSSKGFNVDGLHIVAVKKEGALYLYKNSCPHLQIPLEHTPHHFLDSGKEFIICSNHGALFEIESGHCLSGPCLNQSLTSISFEVENNTVYIHTDV